MVKILSWDIGVKNLAYAVIEEIDEKRTIIEWNIINLLPDPQKCYLTTCKSNAVYMCSYKNVETHWCEKHGNIYDTLKEIATNNGQPTDLSKIEKIKIINCKTISTDELRLRLIRNLDMKILSILLTQNIDYVLIELQPVKKNPAMKALADTLQAWFLIRGVSDSKTVKEVKLINASSKLKQYKNELDKLDGKEKYSATKATSIDVAIRYLKENNNVYWLDYLNKFKKQDDLCDSLLQGFAWLDRGLTKPKTKRSDRAATSG